MCLNAQLSEALVKARLGLLIGLVSLSQCTRPVEEKIVDGMSIDKWM